MRRSLRTRSLAAAAAALGLAAVAIARQQRRRSRGDRRGRGHAVNAAHKCLVMTGSGDPAFTKNFNPYAGGGLPSNSIAQGAFYEPLIVTPGGRHARRIPWLARSWKWSNGNKTLTLNLARNAKWSDGKRLTSADVVYSLTAGRQDKAMDRIGLVGADNNIASIRAKGAYDGRDQAQDPGLAVHRGHPQPAVRRPEAHLVQGQGPGDVHESEPCRLRALQPHRTLHDAGLRPEQEPELLAGRAAEGRLPRVRPGVVERRGARADPERPGRLDAQLRPERRAGVRGEGQEALPRVLLEPRLPDLARLRRHAVPVQHRCVPQGAQPRDRPQLGLEARRVRLRAAGRRDRAERSLPAVGHRQVGEGAGEGDDRRTTRPRPRRC